MKTTREFVQDLFDNATDILPMTPEDAQEDLKAFRADGWDIPEDLDAETYCEIWNDLVNKRNNAKTWNAIDAWNAAINGETEEKKEVGTWWNDSSIELVNIDGSVYALNGWNGEKWTDCWECTGKYLTEASEEKYIIVPIYSEEENENGGYDVIDYEVE